MSRTLLILLALALAASPVVAQHGPPPGYTDPTVYAQDYAAQQVADAQADPVGYAQGKDPAAEAEHTAWLACWTAYEAGEQALDPVCSEFFTAPVTVEPVQEVEAEITEVLDDAGVSALADEALDAVGDTVDDPLSAVDQAERVVGAVMRFVEDLFEFVIDLLGLGGMAIAAGLLGGVLGIIDLLQLPLDGLSLASAGLADVGRAIATVLGLAGAGLATASSAVGHGIVDGAQAQLAAVVAVAKATAHGVSATIGAIGAAVAAVGRGLGDAASASGQTVGDATQAVGHGIGDAADAVRDTVVDVAHKVSDLFDGGDKRPVADDQDLPDTPKTGTPADGLVDRLLDSV